MAKEETIVVAVNQKMRNKDLILHDLSEVVEVDKPDPKDTDREKETKMERTVKDGAQPVKVKKTAFVMAHLRGGDLVHVQIPRSCIQAKEVLDQSESKPRGAKKKDRSAISRPAADLPHHKLKKIKQKKRRAKRKQKGKRG